VCRVMNAELPEDASSIPWARRLVSDLLDRWEMPALGEPAALLTSELVTNALLHAESGRNLGLTITVSEGVLEVGVSDHSSDPITPETNRPNVSRGTDEGGRGLLLVDSLSDEWGVAPLADGKQVWFRLSADEWIYRSACTCPGPGRATDLVRLESGRYAAPIPGPWDEPSPGRPG
jgi:anti-sigma regulatory factor (Ser/Thr protein kinase)